MAHYAHINKDDIVDQVIVIEADVLATGLWGDPSEWVQTSYRTQANQHPEGRPLRGNFAGIGYKYDRANDVFYAPQPFPSWVLNQATWTWEAPTPMPTDGKMYTWDEDTTSWKEVVVEPAGA